MLLSGGIDSATCLAVARAAGHETHAVSFDYGQRHRVELARAAKVAAQNHASSFRVLPIDLRAVGGSALTSDIAVPKDRADSATEIPVTYVPARNLIMLSMAAAIAEVVGARDIYIGVNAVDYSGYPDCRPEFIDAFTRAANLATRVGVESHESGGHYRIQAPLLHLTKAAIIAKGAALGVDYSLTLSCYDPDSQARACGHCDSCRIRAKGFADASVADPTRYMPGVHGVAP